MLRVTARARVVARGVVLVLLTSGAVLLSGGTAAQADFTASPTPSWTPTAGRVYAAVRTGSTVVLGGTFTSLRSPDDTVVAQRAGLAAFDAATGALLPWNPGALGGEVRALVASGDGSALYVGGTFTSLAGQPRSGLGAVLMSSGAALPGFSSSLAGGGAYALARVNSTLYVGGLFTQINGVYRSRLAAVSTTSGALVTSFQASASWKVATLEPGVDGRLLVGGDFRTLSGQPRDYLGAVDPITGAATAWRPPPACLNTSNPCYVFDVVMDGAGVYAAIGGPGGQVRAYDSATGAGRWDAGTDGDVQAVALDGGTLYAGGHFDTSFSGKPRAGIVALATGTGAVLDSFKPLLLGGTGVWAILVSEQALQLVGHFSTVNGLAEPGNTRFAVKAPPVTVVARGSAWSVREDGVAPDPSWTSTSYDDSAWRRGRAQLGFGDGDESTVLAKGRTSYYLRHAFQLPSGATYADASVSLLRDDGAIVYVNGVEVIRSNMPAGPVDASTSASSGIAGAEETAYAQHAVPVSALRSGTNVITVEVHQAGATSSDLSFDLGLSLH